MSPAELTIALSGLGQIPEDIAHSLLSLGIKGFQRSDEYCPLCRYLKKQGATMARVGNVIIEWWDGSLRHELRLTSVQENFVRAFDDGKYPDLIA